MSAAPDQEFQSTAFGAYTLRSVVSTDLTTAVYRATAPDGGDVALRVVDEQVAVHPRAVKGFLHVNQRIAEVGHPHLLSVIDQGTHAGTAYAATGWRDGLWLGDLLLESAPLDVVEVLRLGGQLAEALDSVHTNGIVHGTVGLQTVWVRRRAGSRVPPSAALTGFGTSHLLGPVMHRVEDEAAAVDLLFVAPEQLRGEPAGPAADQYALACVLYTAVTGTTPFRGETHNELFGAHLFGTPAPVSEVRDDLDERWDALFARALAKDPGERFENCRTLLLDAGRRSSPRPASGAAAAPQVVTVTAEETAEFEHAPRRTLLVVLSTLLMVALALLLAIMFGTFGTSAAPEQAAVTGRIVAAVVLPGGV